MSGVGSSNHVAFVLLFAISISGCKSDEQPPPITPDVGTTADVSTIADAKKSTDATAKDLIAVDVTLGDAPKATSIACKPGRIVMSKINACAQASVVIDHTKTPTTCTLETGEARTGGALMLFTRQDDPCAGPGISEIVFFISTNKTIEFLSSTKGVIEKADKYTLREIPYLVVVDTTFALAADPTKKFWMRLRAGKDIEVLDLRAL